MQRLLLGLLTLILLSGCGTSPVNSETTREVVLQYLGGDVGTAGPFYKGGKKELTGLSDADRRQAEALIDGGAALFLVYAHPQGGGTATGDTRVVLVQNNKIVGDFKGTTVAAPTPAPATAP